MGLLIKSVFKIFLCEVHGIYQKDRGEQQATQTKGYPKPCGLQAGLEKGNCVPSGEGPAKWAELIKCGTAVNILEGVALMR